MIKMLCLFDTRSYHFAEVSFVTKKAVWFGIYN